MKGKGKGKHMIPMQISKRLANKKAIKPEIRGLPWQFFLKTLTPQRFWQKLDLPPPVDPVCIYG
jgi:hypothetical protein